jgi:site-specific DNA-methyltransferase (adenine-specific)
LKENQDENRVMNKKIDCNNFSGQSIGNMSKVFQLRNQKTIKLYNLDCLMGLDLFPDDYFDVVVTSPPYNIGTSYNSYEDNIPQNKYLEFIEKVSTKIKQKMKNNGSFFLNISSTPTKPWIPFEIAHTLSPQFVLQNTIHWIKSIYIENESYGNKTNINVGHYKPIPGNRFLNHNHEFIFHFTKTGKVQLDRLSIGVPYKDVSNINRWGSKGRTTAINSALRCIGDVWYIPHKTIRFRDKDRPHPATFPIELPEKCIKFHGITTHIDDNTTVLDPFMGIGSTSLACNKIRVNCVGFEIDNNYYETNIQFLKSEITNLDIWKDISSTNQQNITNSITYDKVVKKNSNLQRTRFREKIIID